MLCQDGAVDLSTPSPPGLRERNKERKRDRIRAAALGAFAARGFEEVTVEEIAEQAEVSKSTLFRYFPTKEDLVLGDDSRRLDALRAAFVDRPSGEAVVESLRAALVSLAGAYQVDRQELLGRYRIIRSTPALMARSLEQQAAREDALASAIADRLPGDEIRPKVLAAAGMAVVRVAMKEWLTTGPDADLADLVADALDVLAAELAPAPVAGRR